MNLADEVEDLFIKHFAEEDRRKARKYLKPHQHTESHSVTFFIGEFLDWNGLVLKLQDSIFYAIFLFYQIIWVESFFINHFVEKIQA